MKTLKETVSEYKSPTISLIILEKNDVVRTSGGGAENGGSWGSDWDLFE